MNKKIFKILFILSFVPIALVLVNGIYGFFNGSSFLWSTYYYGLDALFNSIFLG